MGPCYEDSLECCCNGFLRIPNQGPCWGTTGSTLEFRALGWLRSLGWLSVALHFLGTVLRGMQAQFAENLMRTAISWDAATPALLFLPASTQLLLDPTSLPKALHQRLSSLWSRGARSHRHSLHLTASHQSVRSWLIHNEEMILPLNTVLALPRSQCSS